MPRIQRRGRNKIVTSTSKTMLVRIHPPQPNHGYHMETYIMSGSGYPKFDWRKGGYSVDAKTALKLSRVKNNPEDPYSRLAFQVVTPDEAEAMEEAEKEVAATSDSPHPIPKKVLSKLKQKEAEEAFSKKGEDLEGWDADDDQIPDEDDETEIEEKVEKWRQKGPIETADEDDLAELEEYEREATREATEANDLTTADLRQGTTKKTPQRAVRPSQEVSKKATKKVNKKATKKVNKKATKKSAARSR